MPESKLVVSDTSPLLNLSLIDQLELLKDQFESITAPGQVWEEIVEGDAGVEKLEELRDEGFLEIVEVAENDLFLELSDGLDMGESAAIKHSIETSADLILLDEKEGREAARRHGLNTTGVIGILIKASKNGDVNLEKALDDLKSEGFWISEELYQRVVEL